MILCILGNSPFLLLPFFLTSFPNYRHPSDSKQYFMHVPRDTNGILFPVNSEFAVPSALLKMQRKLWNRDAENK